MTTAPRPILFTLVHGTFAKRAEWTEPDSEFSKRLRASFPGRSIDFVPFPWSGANSNWDRRRDATRLASHVRQCEKEHPDHEHFLVGHSHGGTVALLAYAQVPDSIRGVACLSTPFVHVRQRPTPEELGKPFAAGILAIVFTLLTARADFGLGSVDYLVVVVLSALVLRAVVGWAFGAQIFRSFSERAARTEAEWALPVLPANLLIVRVAGDEASAVLAFSRLASWMSAKSHGALLWASTVAFVFGLGLAITAIFAKMQGSDIPLNFVFGGLAFLAGAAWIASAVVATIAVGFMAVCSVAFGWDAPLSVLTVERSVEETPKGDWMTHQLSFAAHREDGALFEHSKAYEAPEATRHIVDWVRAILDRDSAESPAIDTPPRADPSISARILA